MSPPLMLHVDESKFLTLQARLEAISRLSIDFVVLLAGSTVIATLGLFQNSSAVIIGAMIIAPLMRPLVGLSLGTLTGDSRLLMRGSITLLAGTLVGASIACVMALCIRSLELTPEILGRTHPTLLDLGVALFAGAVGAYCQTNEKLADTLAGVAISVALVPPLSVVGIGLAFNSVSVWSGAALLYATNLIGITAAGAIVFLLMGYSPLKQAKKGLAVTAAMTLLLIVPLALSMRELVLENQLEGSVRRILKEKTFTFKGIQLHSLRVKRFRTPVSVVATVLGSEQPVTPNQVRLVQEFLTKEIGVPIEFKLRIIPSTVVTAIEVTSRVETETSVAPTDNMPDTNTIDQPLDAKQKVPQSSVGAMEQPPATEQQANPGQSTQSTQSTQSPTTPETPAPN
jgi:uncharacterized hydrophobic protein (TIGR00271 family)